MRITIPVTASTRQTLDDRFMTLRAPNDKAYPPVGLSVLSACNRVSFEFQVGNHSDVRPKQVCYGTLFEVAVA